MNVLPVLVQIDGPGLDAKPFKMNIGPQLPVDLATKQDALVPGSVWHCGLAVARACERLVEVLGMQLAGPGTATVRRGAGPEGEAPGPGLWQLVAELHRPFGCRAPMRAWTED